MILTCPNCGADIKAENVNVSSDFAKCDLCNSLHQASKLVKSLPKVDIDQPPAGTKLKFKRGYDGSVELFCPAKGFSPTSIPLLIFAVFWIGFVAFWTWGASQASVLFAMFSIPFWLVGIGMVVGVVNSITESQTIKLTQRELRLKKSRAIKPKEIILQTREIQSIEMYNPKASLMTMFSNTNQFKTANKNQTRQLPETPTIITSMKTEHFFGSLNQTEQIWAVSVLQDALNKFNYK